MKGTIRTKEKCPICLKMFEHVKKLGLICPEHKTTPKRYFVDIYHQGKQIKIYRHRSGRILDSYQIASETLENLHHEIRNHKFDISKYVKGDLRKYSISYLLDNFLTFKIKGIAPSYKTDYMRMIRIAQNYFENKDVRELRKIDLINYKNHLENTFVLKGKTVKNILDVLKTFFRYLKNDLEIIDTIPSFPSVEVQQAPFQWISSDVQISLFNLVPLKHKPIIAFLFLSGCRPSEARALKAKDINLRNHTLTISSTFSGTVYRTKRKGRNAQQLTMPIHPELYSFFESRVKNNLPESFIFINPTTGRYYSKNALQRIWNTTKKKAGIRKDLRLYDATRHSFASQLVNSGTSIYQVSKLLGHSSVKMTEKYSHSNMKSLQAEIRKLSLSYDSSTIPELSLKKSKC
jgi:integrase